MANSGIARQSCRDNEPLPLLSNAVNLEYKRSIWAGEKPVSSLIRVISSSCNIDEGLFPMVYVYILSWSWAGIIIISRGLNNSVYFGQILSVYIIAWLIFHS